jgi:hypothetical protein
MSDFELSAALRHRTLCPSERTYCQHCGSRSEIIHMKCVQPDPSGAYLVMSYSNMPWQTLWLVPRLWERSDLNPWTPGPHLRTDLSLSGSQASGTEAQDFDIAIISLASGQFRSTDPNKNALQQAPSRAAQAKNTKYASRTASKYFPLLFFMPSLSRTWLFSDNQTSLPVGNTHF